MLEIESELLELDTGEAREALGSKITQLCRACNDDAYLSAQFLPRGAQWVERGALLQAAAVDVSDTERGALQEVLRALQQHCYLPSDLLAADAVAAVTALAQLPAVATVAASVRTLTALLQWDTAAAAHCLRQLAVRMAAHEHAHQMLQTDGSCFHQLAKTIKALCAQPNAAAARTAVFEGIRTVAERAGSAQRAFALRLALVLLLPKSCISLNTETSQDQLQMTASVAQLFEHAARTDPADAVRATALEALRNLVQSAVTPDDATGASPEPAFVTSMVMRLFNTASLCAASDSSAVGRTTAVAAMRPLPGVVLCLLSSAQAHCLAQRVLDRAVGVRVHALRTLHAWGAERVLRADKAALRLALVAGHAAKQPDKVHEAACELMLQALVPRPDVVHFMRDLALLTDANFRPFLLHHGHTCLPPILMASAARMQREDSNREKATNSNQQQQQHQQQPWVKDGGDVQLSDSE